MRQQHLPWKVTRQDVVEVDGVDEFFVERNVHHVGQGDALAVDDHGVKVGKQLHYVLVIGQIESDYVIIQGWGRFRCIASHQTARRQSA